MTPPSEERDEEKDGKRAGGEEQEKLRKDEEEEEDKEDVMGLKEKRELEIDEEEQEQEQEASFGHLAAQQRCMMHLIGPERSALVLRLNDFCCPNPSYLCPLPHDPPQTRAPNPRARSPTETALSH
eukprot:753243-Hanusia_phi.AAC.3